VTSNEGEGGNGVRRDSGSKGYLVYCVSAPIVREIMSCVVAGRLSWAGNLWWGDEVRQTSITIYYHSLRGTHVCFHYPDLSGLEWT
jgi:hypothetical protein